MTKVKLIRCTREYQFESAINEFIDGRKVIDIKYQMTSPTNATVYSAMIIYEEE